MTAPRFARNPIYDHAASQPANQQAGKIIGKGGDAWTPEIKLDPTYVREEVGVLPMRKPDAAMRGTGFDITGQRFGNFVVKGLGLLRDPARWVVRCDCGAYEHRTAKSLRTTPKPRLCCAHCDYLNELKAGRKLTKTIAERRVEKPPDPS